jgi:2-phospho-L-lactate guanylyltransferase
MTCWVVVPIKAPAACKTRLAGVLGEEARAALVARMLAHVVAVAGAAPGIDRVLLVGLSRHALDPAIPLIPDRGLGLNAALADACGMAVSAQVDRLIVLPADLPELAPEEVAALAALAPDRIGVAPDRHGRGTNALSLPLPAAAGFRFAFGAASYAAHRDEAARIGLATATVDRPGLARDIDEPADLALL